jgi:hypothetical protein
MADFRVENYGSVGRLIALTPEAEEFACDNFGTEPWQGTPENFSSDWRVIANLAEQLVSEGWVVS